VRGATPPEYLHPRHTSGTPRRERRSARVAEAIQRAEAIVGEENSASLLWLNQAQAMAAGSGILADFLVRWEAISRRVHGRANCVRDFCWYGHDSNGLHDDCPHVNFVAAALDRSSREPFCSNVGRRFIRIGR